MGVKKHKSEIKAFCSLPSVGSPAGPPVLLGTPTSVGYELCKEKGETVLTVALECDLLLSTTASALQGFNLSSYSLSKS